jgi:hypothetical protein
MRCDFSIELLNAYLDNELDEKQKLFVEGHLKDCPACRAELEELKGCDRLLKQREIEEPSNKFLLGFENRIIAAVAKKTRTPLIWRISPILVPVASAALITFFVLVNREKTQPIVGLDERVPGIGYVTERKDESIKKAEPVEKMRQVTKGWDLKEVSGKKAEAASEERAPATISKSATTPPAPVGGITTVPGAAAAPRPISTESRDEELLTDDGLARSQAKMAELNIPKNKVVRAIVDSTGRVVRVVTGNTIQPEEDKLLEQQLEGQQLAPRSSTAGQTQNLLYLDLTQQSDTDTSKPDSLKTHQ